MGKNKIIIFLFLCFLGLVGGFLFAGLAEKAQAANDINFIPQVTVGDFTAKEAKPITPNSIGEYIVAIYKYAIGIVGILAAVVMMFGGVRWIMAGGNASAISEAKAWIGAALTGLLLALGSWMILNTVNPTLVTIQPINPQKAENIVYGCCEGLYRCQTNITRDDCYNNFEDPSWREGKNFVCNENDECVDESAIGCCQVKDSITTYPYCKDNVKRSECSLGLWPITFGSYYSTYFIENGVCETPDKGPCVKK